MYIWVSCANLLQFGKNHGFLIFGSLKRDRYKHFSYQSSMWDIFPGERSIFGPVCYFHLFFCIVYQICPVRDTVFGRDPFYIHQIIFCSCTYSNNCTLVVPQYPAMIISGHILFFTEDVCALCIHTLTVNFLSRTRHTHLPINLGTIVLPESKLD